MYLEEKYKVFVGTKTNIGLCTCWNDPNLLINQDPSLLEKCAIIGTLYSREGVSIMLRNLCLNPSIDTVVIWANNPLSNTAIGLAGRTLLKNVWAFDTVEGIHKEISGDVLKTVRKNVVIIDLSALSFVDMSKEVSKLIKKSLVSYMEPVSFPEPKREAMSAMPSEKVGISVRGKTLTQTWVKVVDKIIRYGAVKKTENASNQKELQSVAWTIHEEDLANLSMPDWPDSLKKHVGFDNEILNQYKTIFTDPEKPAGSAYTYGNRLNNYIGQINQVEEIIKKLKHSAATRQAFATTFYPPQDLKQPSPPCLTQVHLLTGEGAKLNLFASFRSHDIFKAAIPNAFGLLHLHNHIANEAGFVRGSLTITSVSAHIYEEDWKMALDTVKCALWESAKLYFDENEDIDPRGMVRVSLKKGLIHVEVVTSDGEELFAYDGKSAREVAMKLARLELLSLYSHYVDISIELVKAEIALKNGKVFIQDRPFILDKIVIK